MGGDVRVGGGGRRLREREKKAEGWGEGRDGDRQEFRGERGSKRDRERQPE